MICAALEKELPSREEVVKWASDLPDTDMEKARLLKAAKWQLAAVRSAYEKLRSK